MTSTPRTRKVLPCGVPLDRLTDQVVERTPPPDPEHQADCQYCRAALAELRQLWSPLLALADEEVQAPPGLVERVMADVRALDSTGARAVLPGERGTTSIAVEVIAVIARKAADGVPGTLLAMTGLEDGVDVGAVGRSLVIRLDLVAAWGTDLLVLSQQIRRVVREHVAALTGLTVVAVDIEVVEVVDAEGGSEPA